MNWWSSVDPGSHRLGPPSRSPGNPSTWCDVAVAPIRLLCTGVDGSNRRVDGCHGYRAVLVLGTVRSRGLVPRTREERVTKKTLFGTRTESRTFPTNRRGLSEGWSGGAQTTPVTKAGLRAIPSGITRGGNLVPMDSTGGYKTLETSEQDIGLRDMPSEAEVWHKILVALERLVADLS